MKIAAIVLAAGRSTRMGTAGDKLFADLAGQPVLRRTLEAFERALVIEAIVLVTSHDRIAECRALVDASGLKKVVAIVRGGERRRDSSEAGTDALRESGCEIVLVHDGARPLVDGATIERAAALAYEHGAAVASGPVVDTIKRVDADGRVIETLPRAELRAIQTPQAFRYELLIRAFAHDEADATDDAALVERMGTPVWTFAAPRTNLKITTPEDLAIAASILAVGVA